MKSGREIAARLAQVVYDVDGEMVDDGEEMCVIQMDMENAFNLQARRVIFNGLLQYAPKLVRIFRKFYGTSSKLFLKSGECMGICATGVKQGCPFGSPLLLCRSSEHFARTT